jgi:hypothetical protein
MLGKTMIGLATAAALTGGLTAVGGSLCLSSGHTSSISARIESVMSSMLSNSRICSYTRSNHPAS